MSDFLPSWLLPDPATVRSDARIAPDQAKARGGDDVLAVDIANRIEEMGAFVLGKLRESALRHQALTLPISIGDPIGDVLAPDQKVTARSATRMLVVAALHGITPTDRSLETARLLADGRGEAVTGAARLGSALSLLESLDTQLQEQRAAQQRQTAEEMVTGAEALELTR